MFINMDELQIIFKFRIRIETRKDERAKNMKSGWISDGEISFNTHFFPFPD